MHLRSVRTQLPVAHDLRMSRLTDTLWRLWEPTRRRLDESRYGFPILMFVSVTLIMGTVGLWLQWAKDTDRWHMFGIYFAVCGVVMWVLHRKGL